MDEIKTGVTGMGLRWAATGQYRVMTYVGGGYSCQNRVLGDNWKLFRKGETMPEDIEQALCAELGIPCKERVPQFYDVRASIFELNGNGSDGAYDLLLDGATPDEILSTLARYLRGGFGLTNAGPCRLCINIGPAGRGDDLPI